MLQALGIVFSIILTSFYLFPVEISYFPIANTKMIMAGVSLLLLPYVMVKNKEHSAPRWFLTISIWGAIVSLFGLLAIVLNGTNDMTYATYIISMWVWLGGAFTLNYVYNLVHNNEISVHLVIRYLMVVCVLQCIFAIWIDNNTYIKNFIDNIIYSQRFVSASESRLYGIGASLDVAGIRFSAVLIMIAALLAKYIKQNKANLSEQVLLMISFMIIAVIGNIMARTTTIGIAVALVTFFIVYHSINDKAVSSRSFILIASVVTLTICFVVYYYYTNPNFQEQLRFGFEGFFSLVETGEWRVQSNEILKNMIVWPDSIRTWIVGDGYIVNPKTDPYYIGPITKGYYMNTDIGYLRFIYYFGIFGTLAFIIFMWEAAKACIAKFPSWKIMFVMLLLLNYIIWLKVSTDIFSIFAIFLTMQGRDNSESAGDETLKIAT